MIRAGSRYYRSAAPLANALTQTKRALVRMLYEDMQTDAGATPVMVCTQRLAVSLARVYAGERERLDLPLPGMPLALASALQDE